MRTRDALGLGGEFVEGTEKGGCHTKTLLCLLTSPLPDKASVLNTIES